jgi:hypothetical protein
MKRGVPSSSLLLVLSARIRAEIRVIRVPSFAYKKLGSASKSGGAIKVVVEP